MNRYQRQQQRAASNRAAVRKQFPESRICRGCGSPRTVTGIVGANLCAKCELASAIAKVSA
jgi:hypothetical protein